MILEIKYFGRIEELIALESEQCEFKDTLNVKQFRSWLLIRYPQLMSESFQIAINQDLKTDEYEILEASEIAILPPFAGG